MSSSDFALRVYTMLQKVPAGKVVTYRILGDALGTRAYRGIGQVLKRNPQIGIIPCHRVIRSDLTIGGFMGAMHGECIERKRTMLAGEGVKFNEWGKLEDPNRLYLLPRAFSL
jgi:methylated-DNA-[protein]-cysteine S-methyltransferase